MNKPLRIALIADSFPPLRSSGSVQLRDLSLEMLRQGHSPVVMVPSSVITDHWEIEEYQGIKVVRLKSPQTRGVGYVKRTLNELIMPHSMLRNLRKCPLGDVRWDGVVWYSPTICLGPIVKALKNFSQCKSYLILRDIFPDWAVDMGLIKKGLVYRFLKIIEQYQYSVADVIGVQTAANVSYFDQQNTCRIEVLQNWLAESKNQGSSISIAESSLAGRIIFVYAGNMGVAQGLKVIIDLAEKVSDCKEIGFLFVGRGSEVQKLRKDVQTRKLDNVLFENEIDPLEIAGLYAQCHVGIVSLDPRHTTHNIPGKFLSYMQSGMPVFASVNPGNDLVEMIQNEGVGRVCTDASPNLLAQLAIELKDEIVSGKSFVEPCHSLSNKLFSPSSAVKQIIQALY